MCKISEVEKNIREATGTSRLAVVVNDWLNWYSMEIRQLSWDEALVLTKDASGVLIDACDKWDELTKKESGR